MIFTRFLPSRSLFTNPIQQVRFFARFPNRLSQYLRRAELIESIRVAIRSGKGNSLPSLLNTRLLDSFVVTQVLRCAPSADSALSLMETLKKVLNFQHSHSTLHALAAVFSKFRRNAELKSLIGAIFAGKFRYVRVSFMNLMQWYATAGDLEAVLRTWDEFRGAEKRVSTEGYNIVMWLYVQKGRHLEAVEVFHQMINEGAIPNCRTYTVMIEHLVSLGKLDSAREVFSMLPLMRIKRTLKQFSVLVEAFIDAERYDEAKSLLADMKDDGKFPTRGMYPSLQQMKEVGYVEEVEQFLREMLPDGSSEESSYEDGSLKGDADRIKLKPYLDPKALASAMRLWNPELVAMLEGVAFVWTTRMVCKVLWNFSSADTAWNFFCWVARQPGFTHDVYTIERMITLSARHGYPERVDELLDKVRAEGKRLSFSTLRLLIDFYGFSRNADAALKVFLDNRVLCGPISKLNLMLLYSSLLRTLTKCGRDHDALDVLEHMVSEGIFPDIPTFSGLIFHFALQGETIIVELLFSLVRKCGMGPDAYMYNVLIQAYCKSRRAVLAWRVFKYMMNSKLILDFSTKELLLKSLWEKGWRREAAVLEESCNCENGVLPLVLHGHIWRVSSVSITGASNSPSEDTKLFSDQLLLLIGVKAVFSLFCALVIKNREWMSILVVNGIKMAMFRV